MDIQTTASAHLQGIHKCHYTYCTQCKLSTKCAPQHPAFPQYTLSRRYTMHTHHAALDESDLFDSACHLESQGNTIVGDLIRGRHVTHHMQTSSQTCTHFAINIACTCTRNTLLPIGSFYLNKEETISKKIQQSIRK